MSPPAPQPEYVFRGHTSAVHAATFIRGNSRLLTGDADGWVVCWDTAIRRPTAVWQAHTGTILGLGSWGEDKVITHGKDNKLVVWRLSRDDEPDLCLALPLETTTASRRAPWMLHSLDVNTMNFCAFAQCPEQSTAAERLLIAVPNTLSSESVDIFRLPDSQRIHTVPNASELKGGMIMAVRIFHHRGTKALCVVAGYESGHVAVSTYDAAAAAAADDDKAWRTVYLSRPHSQPVLSFDVLPDHSCFLSSSADALIVKHPIPAGMEKMVTSASDAAQTSTATQIVRTGHAGQQDLSIRSDARVFATAGWDGRARVYSVATMEQLAVLKWHPAGCYAVAFAQVMGEGQDEDDGRSPGESNALSPPTLPPIQRHSGHVSVREKREARAQQGHWLVVGSKDAKISLWEVY